MAEQTDMLNYITKLDRLYRTYEDPRVKVLIDIENLKLKVVKRRMSIAGDKGNKDLVNRWSQDISVIQKTLSIAMSPTPANEQDRNKQITELDTELKEAQRLAAPN